MEWRESEVMIAVCLSRHMYKSIVQLLSLERAIAKGISFPFFAPVSCTFFGPYIPP